ncbi:MAG: DUF2249 domain-containing protein [Calditrichaeota bacterium]|nr:MAG: DUF2249 domain-containing protein [Calditrichota bacterium]MBL1204512.1 DUF2249 domain-containing protein [Calditrichota bacterium]NOG44341.1 DUF2249 domain-containing protein [Calditrichota bacterium]
MQNNPNQHLIVLDVRPILQSGNDPFNEIMKAVANLAEEDTLQIINTFEPIPLINKMKARGYKSWTERPEDGVIHTFFKKEQDNKTSEKLPEVEETDEISFQQKVEFFGEKKHTIDVRHLEMPEPMVAILKEIETLDDDHALFVEHKKMPQFLLPELKNRNYDIMFNELSEHHLQLLIFKAK